MALPYPRCRLLTTLLLLGLPTVLVAETPATGDLWEVTSKMTMEGMPMEMPAQKVKVCSPKDWKEPPSGADDRHGCQNSDFKVDGPKATWKVRCAGPPEMKGEGEIIRDGDTAYTGTIKLIFPDGGMTIKLSGKRLDACETSQK